MLRVAITTRRRACWTFLRQGLLCLTLGARQSLISLLRTRSGYQIQGVLPQPPKDAGAMPEKRTSPVPPSYSPLVANSATSASGVVYCTASKPKSRTEATWPATSSTKKISLGATPANSAAWA